MKKVKVSKKGVRKIVAAVAALLAVVVLCYEIGNFNSSNVKTQPAAATTYRNSITVKMFAVRDESLKRLFFADLCSTFAGRRARRGRTGYCGAVRQS